MVVRARTIALLAVAASPLAAQGQSISNLPAVQTPSFDCYSSVAGGLVNYADGESLQPDLGLFSSKDLAAGITYNRMSCNQSKIEDSFANFSGYDMFAVKFEDKTSAAFDWKLDDFSYKPQNVFDKASNQFLSLWDVTLDYKMFNVDGAVIDESKAFIGIQVASDKAFVMDGAFKFVNGELTLDPTIPDPNAVISLYATPQVTPEPGTLVLLGTGLLGLGTAMRRRLGW